MANHPVLDDVFGNYPASIEGITFDERLGRYHIAFRVGYFCRFSEESVSNQLHHHDCFELCIVLEGRGLFIYADNSFPVATGDVFIADPQVRHEIRIKGAETLLLLYFFIDISEIFATRDISYYDGILGAFLAGHKYHVNQQFQLFSYFNFCKSHQNAKNGNAFWINQALKNFILETLEILSFSTRDKKHAPAQLTNNADGDAYLKALDYIYQNLNQRITAREIARYACTSPRNVYYLFRKNMDRTVSDFVNEKKIDLAEHYLNLDFSVAEVSRLVGISDPSVFCRLYKKYKGISPKKYQKSINSQYRNYGIRKIK